MIVVAAHFFAWLFALPWYGNKVHRLQLKLILESSLYFCGEHSDCSSSSLLCLVVRIGPNDPLGQKGPHIAITCINKHNRSFTSGRCKCTQGLSILCGLG